MSDLFDLTDKVAIITGSSRGLGFASALRMAENGAKVVVSGRKADACEAAAAEINKSAKGTGQAIAVPCNISRKAEVENLVQKALSKSRADRFPTLEEFASELKECVIDHATDTRRIDRRTVARPLQKGPSRLKYAIGAAIVVALLLVGVFAWRHWGGRSAMFKGSSAPQDSVVAKVATYRRELCNDALLRSLARPDGGV